jgi:hypothetical protein
MHCSKLTIDTDFSKLTIVTTSHHSTALNCYSIAISRQNCCGKLMAKVFGVGGSESVIDQNMTSSKEDGSDGSWADDVDTKSNGKNKGTKSPVSTSKRKDPATKTKKSPADNDRNIKKTKVNEEKSAKLDFHVKPANSMVSTKSDVTVDRRLDLLEKKVDRRLDLVEKKVRWQHLVKTEWK